jgi:replicative DNA helicase
MQPELKRKELHCMEAEQALLGLLLTHNDTFDEVGSLLRPFHFFSQTHQKIYKVLCGLSEANKEFSPITVAEYLNESDLEAVGGRNYLIDLHQSFFSHQEASHYAELIIDFALRREIVSLNDASLASVYNLEIRGRGKECLETLEKKIFELSEKGTSCEEFSFSEISSQIIQRTEENMRNQRNSKGIQTGFADLDKTLKGMHPANLLILGGRPSMGKTVLGLNIAFHAAKAHLQGNGDGCPVAFFSLEMSPQELASRLLASETGVSSEALRQEYMGIDDLFLIGKVRDDYKDLPLLVNADPGMTISGLRSRARILKRKHNIGLIVIDYLQLIEADKKSHNFVQDISLISKALKNIARELNVPVLALSQLSREVEKRDDKRPQLSDLRESGSIEQDADVVMFVFREEYYEARREPPEGTEKYAEWAKKMESIQNQAEVMISKNRHGSLGKAKLFFDGKTTRFANLVHSGNVTPFHPRFKAKGETL